MGGVWKQDSGDSDSGNLDSGDSNVGNSDIGSGPGGGDLGGGNWKGGDSCGPAGNDCRGGNGCDGSCDGNEECFKVCERSGVVGGGGKKAPRAMVETKTTAGVAYVAKSAGMMAKKVC